MKKGPRHLAPPDSIQLLFPYGSEKEKWITEVTESFNRGEPQRTAGKRPIFVQGDSDGLGRER